MATVRVVPSLDILENRQAGLGMGRELVALEELALEGGEEASCTFGRQSRRHSAIALS